MLIYLAVLNTKKIAAKVIMSRPLLNLKIIDGLPQEKEKRVIKKAFKTTVD